MSKLSEFLNDASLMHNSIECGDFEKVESLLQKYPRAKFILNLRGQSAAATALKSNQFDIYKLLSSYGLYLASHEDIGEIVKSLPKNTKKLLRDVHKVHIKEPSLKHLMTLINRSKLSHDTSEHKRGFYLELIVKAFEELNAIRWIEPMLKVVSNSDVLNIIFDFKRDWIEFMDPLNTKETKGICYPKGGVVYIGAMGLLDGKNYARSLSVIAHELGHYAMKLVYENKCRPYRKVDEPNLDFDAVSKACEEKQEAEEFISIVFQLYDKEVQHAELIVRVPHLLALYKKNPGKLAEVKSKFAELFHFYEKNTLIDIELQHPLMEARRTVKNLNALTRHSAFLSNSEIAFNAHELNLNMNSSSFLTLRSNCPRLTIRMIHQQLSQDKNFEASNVFIKLETLKNEKIFNLIVEAFFACTKPLVIIDCSGHKEEEILLVAEKLSKKKMTERIVCVKSGSSVKEFDVSHSWSQLTQQTQEKLLKIRISFQGRKISLNELLAVDSKALESIPLNDLLHDDIQVGNALVFDELIDYIKRSFLPSNTRAMFFGRYPKVISSGELLRLSEDQRIVLLSDEPGMGKTTEFKVIAKKIKEKFPTRWVEFVDLKQFIEAFEKDKKVFKTFETCDEIAEYLCEKILKVHNFEREFFSHLFHEGRVVLLWDGFDEISPSFKEFNLKLMSAIRRLTSNQLWISTRPHLVEELKANLEQDSYELQPFTEEDRISFLGEKLQSKNVHGEDLAKKLEEVEAFLESLRLNSWLQTSVANPILLRMVAEIFDEDKDVQLLQSNYYSIYETFTKKLIKNYFKKGFEVAEDLVEFIFTSTDIMTFHQKVAFETIFKFEKNDIGQLIETCFLGFTSPPVEQMVRVGLIHSDGSGKLQFIHRTFGEFFIADFFYHKIFLDKINTNIQSKRFPILSNVQKQMDASLTLLRFAWEGFDPKTMSRVKRPVETVMKFNYKMVRKFLDSAFVTLSFEKDSERLKRIKTTIGKVFIEQGLQSVFFQSVIEGLSNMIKIVVFHLADKQTTLNDLWLLKDFGKLKGINAMTVAFEHQSVEFIIRFLSLSDDVLAPEVFKRLFLAKDNMARNIIFHIIANRAGNLDFFLNHPLIPLTTGERQNLLIETDDRGRNLLTHALKYVFKFNKGLAEFLNILQLIRAIFGDVAAKHLLTALDEDNQNILHHACSRIENSNDFKTFCRTLNDNLTRNEIKELFRQRNNFVFGENLMMFEAQFFRDEKVFQVFWEYFEEVFETKEEQTSILLQADADNLTVLQCASKNVNEKVFLFILNAFEDLIGTETVKLWMTSENSEQENILFHALNCSWNEKTVESLWTYMQENFQATELKTILLKQNRSKQNFLEASRSRFDFDEIVKIFDSFVQESLNEAEKLTLLSWKNSK